MLEKFIIGVIVQNHSGVLTRVTSLFSRRGYNIDSLVVAETDNPQYSRMTIVATGNESVKNQIVKQLDKLQDVVTVDVIPHEDAAVREHMLIKIKVASDSNTDITNMINDFGSKVIDFGTESVTVEVTGDAKTNDRFIDAARTFGIMEICRAGAQALNRGSHVLGK